MLATALNGGLSWFLKSTARKSGSAALESDSKHLLSDVISSAGVWLGLLVMQLTGWEFMDSVLAFAVSILIARMGIGLVLKSSSHLMDESCNEEIEKGVAKHTSDNTHRTKEIKKTMRPVDGSAIVYELRTHTHNSNY